MFEITLAQSFHFGKREVKSGNHVAGLGQRHNWAHQLWRPPVEGWEQGALGDG